MKARRIFKKAMYGALEPALALTVDFLPGLFGRGPVPPDWMNFSGSGDFRAIGHRSVTMLADMGGLQPSSRVLEIGCGIGRNALPLIGLLLDGTYDGFDVVRTGIAWCRRRIAPKHRNFTFRHVNVRNGGYNPFGAIDARSFAFPYPNRAFDLVFATSVFTHMLQADVERYVAEAHRVLSPSGRMVLTAFILDDEARALIDQGKSSLTFRDRCGETMVQFQDDPCAAVAYTPDEMVEILRRGGFRLAALKPGSWPGRPGADYQNWILAEPV